MCFNFSQFNRPFCAQKDALYLKVNKLSSIKYQLPYEYYSLPYCRPERIVQSAENLGEVLRGDRIENSLYQVSRHQKSDAECGFDCTYAAYECDHFVLGSLLADPHARG